MGEVFAENESYEAAAHSNPRMESGGAFGEKPEKEKTGQWTPKKSHETNEKIEQVACIHRGHDKRQSGAQNSKSGN